MLKTTKPPTLTPQLKRLAAQLVHERMRRDAWAASAELRRTLTERLAAGATADALEIELISELAAVTGR